MTIFFVRLSILCVGAVFQSPKIHIKWDNQLFTGWASLNLDCRLLSTQGNNSNVITQCIRPWHYQFGSTWQRVKHCIEYLAWVLNFPSVFPVSTWQVHPLSLNIFSDLFCRLVDQQTLTRCTQFICPCLTTYTQNQQEQELIKTFLTY